MGCGHGKPSKAAAEPMFADAAKPTLLGEGVAGAGERKLVKTAIADSSNDAEGYDLIQCVVCKGSGCSICEAAANGNAAAAAACSGLQEQKASVKDAFIGTWVSSIGSYQISRGSYGQLNFREGSLHGVLVVKGDNRSEGKIRDASRNDIIVGSLQLKVEGNRLRSAYKPVGSKYWDPVGYLSNRAKGDIEDPTDSIPSRASTEPTIEVSL